MKKLLLGLGIAWAFALLFFAWQWSQNGRYYLNANEMVIDTRTGAVFNPDEATGRTVQIAGPVEPR